MAGELAIPTFVAGAKDDVATVDVYKQNNSAVITNIQDVKPEQNLLAATALRGGNALKDGLKSAVGVAKNTKSFLDLGSSAMSALATVQSSVNLFKTGNILQKLSASGSILSGPLGKVLPSLTGDILGGVNESSSIFATVNGLTQRIKSTNLKDINSISNVIGSVTGNPAVTKFTDTGTSVGALSGIIKTASNRGMPDSFGALMSTVTDIDSVNKVAGQCVPAVVSSCDIGSLRSMGNLTSSSFLKLQNPNILKDFSNNYSFTSEPVYHEMTDKYASVTEAYSSVDSSWNKSTRYSNGQTDEAINLTAIQNASIDLNKVLRVGALNSTSFDDKILLLAPLYPATSVKSELSQSFPILTTELNQSEQNNSKSTIDPITMIANNLTRPKLPNSTYVTDGNGTIVNTSFSVNSDGGEVIKTIVSTDKKGNITTDIINTTVNGTVTTQRYYEEKLQWQIPGTPEYNKRQEMYAKTHSTQGRKWKSRAAQAEWENYTGYASRELLWDNSYDEN